MLKLAWASDIHLDLCSEKQRLSWIEDVRLTGADVLLLSGDLSNCKLLQTHLEEMHRLLAPMEIRFVLGNHDFWDINHRMIYPPDVVREFVRQQVGMLPRLVYVHDVEVKDPRAQLGPLTCLGVDGWWDARSEPCVMEPATYRWRAWADHDTRMLELRLDRAIAQGAKQILILTHVPPFTEASTCSRPGASKLLFVNVALGRMVALRARHHPEVQFLVLCGHTHEEVDYLHAPNLRVLVRKAEYEAPGVKLLRFYPDTGVWA